MNDFISNYTNIPNPITKFFNKIDYVWLKGDYSKIIEWFEAMKKVPLYVKSISIYSNNAEELENLTDPNLHNAPIDNLKLILCESFEISSKTIENLKSIYPNSITLGPDHETKGEAANQVLFGNLIKLLSKLDHTSLEVSLHILSYDFKLEFNNVIFKVVESKKECSYIRAKSAKIYWKAEELCRIK